MLAAVAAGMAIAQAGAALAVWWLDLSPLFVLKSGGLFLITVAVAALGGVRFPRWFMLSAQVVYTLGLVLAYWLFEQAMFEIGALCPWCLLVTLATTLVFFELTYVNIRDDNLLLPRRLQNALTAFVQSNLDIMLVIAWLLVLVLAVVLKYGDALFA